MYINRLRLTHFRNYDLQELELFRDRYFIVGGNAQGKTNLIEAMYLCAMGKSHRTNDDADLIQSGYDSAQVRALVMRRVSRQIITLKLNRHSKNELSLNDIPQGAVSQLLGILNCVMFAPGDISLISEAPASRRRFLDRELCQVYPSYVRALRQYDGALRQRNALLKERDRFSSIDFASQLLAFDEPLSRAGAYIYYQRKKLIETLSVLSGEKQGELSGKKEKLALRYVSNLSDDCEGLDGYKKALIDSRASDMRFRTTCAGIHRDDMIFELDGTDIRDHASQGQRRSAMISLKLSEVDMIKRETGYYPVLLLDDVFSELDSQRKKYLLRSIRNVQTFITGTETGEIDTKDMRILRVEKGYVYT